MICSEHFVPAATVAHCPVAAEKSAALVPVIEMPVTCNSCWPIFATLTDWVTSVPSRALPKSSDGGTEATGPVLPLLEPVSVIVSAAETPGKLSVRIPVCNPALLGLKVT